METLLEGLCHHGETNGSDGKEEGGVGENMSGIGVVVGLVDIGVIVSVGIGVIVQDSVYAGERGADSNALSTDLREVLSDNIEQEAKK